MGDEVARRHWTFTHRGGVWNVHEIRTSRRKVEVYVSPTGRSQRVFVDGEEVR